MQIDPQLVRDLFACCRKMQMELHHVSVQALAIQTFIDDRKMVEKCASNIDSFTAYIYRGQDGFPNVATTLEETRAALLECGEWQNWSDYVGFRDVKDGAK